MQLTVGVGAACGGSRSSLWWELVQLAVGIGAV